MQVYNTLIQSDKGVPMAKAAPAESGADSRELILSAALKAFAEKGFDGATTRDIATRAGVNHGLIPYYFGGKPNLWRAAVDLAFGKLDAGLKAVLEDTQIQDDQLRTRMLVRGYVRFVAENPEFVYLMHEEGKRKGPRMRWIVDRHVKPMFEATSTMLKAAQERGTLPAHIDPIHFHYILAGSVGLIFHQAEECKRVTGTRPDRPRRRSRAHALAVEHLLPRPHPRGDLRMKLATFTHDGSDADRRRGHGRRDRRPVAGRGTRAPATRCSPSWRPGPSATARGGNMAAIEDGTAAAARLDVRLEAPIACARRSSWPSV